MTIPKDGEDFLNWEWLNSQPVETETTFVRHVRREEPITILIDGKKSKAVLLK
jgi:hypothetical protein